MLGFLFAFAVAFADAQSIAPPSPQPTPARELMADAWWTGPMLAPSAGTLPRGHVLVEPYVFDVMQYASYNRGGALTAAPHANSFGSLTYITYGLIDRLSVGIIPVFGFNTVAGGLSSTSARAGDLSLTAQYRIAQFTPNRWIPTTSVAIQESLPMGKYDRLGDRPSDGLGSGAYTTTVSLYMQTYFWMHSGRILRARLNASQSFSGNTSVDGVSVYGTGAGFHGFAKPGNSFTLDAAQEYSITRNWVAALDVVYHHSANTQVTGTTGVVNSGPSSAYYLAPAVEYNWTANSGVLFGIRVIPAGRNASASVTPAIAINMVR